MAMSTDLAAAQSAYEAYATASVNYLNLVNAGSPQPDTNNALAVANSCLTTLKGTQAAIDADYAAL